MISEFVRQLLQPAFCPCRQRVSPRPVRYFEIMSALAELIRHEAQAGFALTQEGYADFVRDMQSRLAYISPQSEMAWGYMFVARVVVHRARQLPPM